MLQRLGARILRARVPVPVALPTDPEDAAVPLTRGDQLTLDDLVHPRYGTDYARKTHAPWRTLVTALLLPGFLLVASTAALLWALPPLDDTLQWRDSYRNGSNVNVFERFEIRTKDHSARATFIPLGATLVDFWVKDREGEWRDVVLGYDNTTEYLTDKRFPYFGAVVGRVANRIANASYTDPSTGSLVHLPANEAGRATLHGGIAGYARSGWRILERSHDRVVFSLVDHAAEGFPGTLDVRTSYTLRSDPVRLTTELEARVVPATDGGGGGGGGEGPTTPIMLSSHVYWNLDGFQAPERGRGTGGSARDHRLWVDADRFLETDGELIPTGTIAPIERDSPLDFSARGGGEDAGLAPTIGERVDLPQAMGLCGTGCKGLDTALVFADSARNVTLDPVAVLESPSSGIRLSIRTNQPALHLFTTPSRPWGLPYPIGLARKASHLPHGKAPEQCTAEERAYPKGGAVAIECEGMVDAVHHAGEEGWGDPWYTPERAYEWWSEYELSTFNE
ncbi:hypothetical protein JCM8208_003573 [Rhodotorula glutinis]